MLTLPDSRLDKTPRWVACVVVGTRPEAIKMSPLIKALKECSNFECSVVSTGQHLEMVREIFDYFDIVIDVELPNVEIGMGLNNLVARVIGSFDSILSRLEPDVVMVHGDTSSALGAALASWHLRIPVAHVEAGLRSGDKSSPWPEEFNRCSIAQIASLHFAPSKQSVANLVREGVERSTIFNVGNTVLDAIRFVLAHPSNSLPSKISSEIQAKTTRGQTLILCTMHRRENWGEGIRNLCFAIKRLLQKRSDIVVIFACHPNPTLTSVVFENLKDLEDVYCVINPAYPEFIDYMQNSDAIFTDSGGLQEEGPFLGKYVYVMRDKTERIEVDEMVDLIGNSEDKLFHTMLGVTRQNNQQSVFCNTPYGDGFSSQKIVGELERYLENN